MPEIVEIKIENQMIKEKRDISIYHHATRSAHIISPNSSIALPWHTLEEDDYLHISVVRGPGNLSNNCVVNISSWVDFHFSSKGDVTVTHLHNRDKDRILLKIPPGPPSWELKIIRPIHLRSGTPLKKDSLIIMDHDMKY